MLSNSSSLMDHLRKMNEYELSSSMGILSNITLSIIKNCSEFLNAGNQCEVYKYQGDYLFGNNEFKNAQIMYHKALQAYKSATKAKNKQLLLGLHQSFSEVDIRYKIYQCCMSVNNDYEALNVLEAIPQKSRQPKIYYAMAKLYQKLGMDKSAIANYKEVLKVSPLALDCAIQLMHLGEHPNVVISIMNIHSQLEWAVPYIKAHGIKLNKDFAKSVSMFEMLNKQTNLSGNPGLLCDLATAYYFSGDQASAIQYFKACNLQDPQWLRGMDLYGYLLCEDEQSDELDKLSSSLFSISQLHPEPWVVMGYQAKLKGDHTKAVYLAARAAELDGTCIQALLLKGVSLRLLNEAKIAVTHFRQAMVLAPSRLDCYSELVRCYIHEYRNNEALNIAKSALDSVGYTPDSLVLCAATYFFDSSNDDQALRMLDRALSINSNHKQAIELRCKIAIRKQKYADAIKLLREAIQNHGSSVFHTLLANCYFKTGKFSEAIDHYNIALSLNSNSTEAKEGLEKIKTSEHNYTLDTDSVEDQNRDISDDSIVHPVSWPQDDWF